MNQSQRLIKIKKILAKKKELQTKEIATHFNISFDTARRDVLRLTSTGQAVRVHGGIMSISANQVPTYITRSHIQSPVKNKMAQAAKKFFQPGKFYFLGVSTSIAQMCNLINGIDASVLTNSLDNAMALMQSNFPTVSILAGQVNKTNRFIYSPQALEELNRVRFDIAFVGASKINSDGIYVADQRDAVTTGRAISRADKTILFAEKYKFTTRNSSPYKTTSFKNIDVLITDTILPQEYRQWLDPHTQVIHVLEA